MNLLAAGEQFLRPVNLVAAGQQVIAPSGQQVIGASRQ
jgi:hypothetical protein